METDRVLQQVDPILAEEFTSGADGWKQKRMRFLLRYSTLKDEQHDLTNLVEETEKFGIEVVERWPISQAILAEGLAHALLELLESDSRLRAEADLNISLE